MITSFLLQIKQPSEEDYLAAKKNTEAPFKLRAQVINSYRKNLLKELWGKGPERVNFPKRSIKNVRANPRSKPTPFGQNSSGNNFFKVVVDVLGTVVLSRGRNRSSNKVKKFSKQLVRMVHLTGYKATWINQYK